jgi:HlyD family secretion protein
MKRETRKLLFALGGLAAAALFALVLFLRLSTGPAREADADTDMLRAVQVRRGTLRETIVANGVIEPRSRVIVQSEIPGIVARVHVDSGDRVAQGQPLVELDKSRLEDQAAELRAAVAAEDARSRVDLVARAEADQAKVRLDHARSLELHRRGVLSQERLEESEHRLEVARIAVSDARAEKEARQAVAAQARRSLEKVERDLERSVIRSSVAGIVVERRVEVGAAVADLQNGGTVVAELADDSSIHLVGEVDERDVGRVREGSEAEIEVDALPGEKFRGVVHDVASAATRDETISFFQVKVEIAPDARLRVGMSALARILVGLHEKVLLVPNSALIQTHDGPRVRVVEGERDDSPEERAVNALYSDGLDTAIADGLRESDYVLVYTSPK